MNVKLLFLFIQLNCHLTAYHISMPVHAFNNAEKRHSAMLQVRPGMYNGPFYEASVICVLNNSHLIMFSYCVSYSYI